MAAISPTAAAERSLILIVEDEALVRLDVAEAFASAGWRVLEAASGEAALSLIAQYQPAVVFTDFSLGGAVTGRDVGAKARTHGARVVYTSGDTKAQASLLPDSVFFLKPYATQAVIQSCRDALGS